MVATWRGVPRATANGLAVTAKGTNQQRLLGLVFGPVLSSATGLVGMHTTLRVSAGKLVLLLIQMLAQT